MLYSSASSQSMPELLDKYEYSFSLVLVYHYAATKGSVHSGLNTQKSFDFIAISVHMFGVRFRKA